MPLPLVRLIAVSLCEALSYAHSLTDARGARLQVVHRDVTPSNIMISKTGAVLLTDFGIARVQGGALTEPGVVRGKVAYLAPEQVLHNAPVDGRADQYSAALTLFEFALRLEPSASRLVRRDAVDGHPWGGAAHHQVAT
jgi:serine/threonine protein kinase